MSNRSPRRVAALAWALTGLGTLAAGAGAALAQSADDSAGSAPGVVTSDGTPRHAGRNDRVSLGRDTDLPVGQTADSVVSVGGSSSSEGEARQDVVSVLGNTRVTGPVGHDAVAVLGDTYVNSHVGGDVVAVLGSVRLGPMADVEGDVVAVAGAVHRDPMAIVRGTVQQVGVGSRRGMGWALPWVRHGAFYLRPLAWQFALAWAWVVALGFLALYACLALIFRDGVERCARTFESHAGQTVLTALLTALLTPVVLVLLVITLVGIAAVPLVVVTLFCASLFGKAAILAWLGQRCLGATAARPRVHPALAVLLGGLIVLVVYLVPLLGIVVFQAMGLLGLGVAIYTLLLATREQRASGPPSGPNAAAAASPGPAGPAPPAAGSAETVDRARPPVMEAMVVPTGPYAGFWIRIAALLIDALLIGIVVHLLPRAGRLELLVLATYGAIMWKLRGTTIGGIVFNLHVVRLDGRPIDWSTAVVRALGCFLSLAIVGLGFFWIAFDDSKQAWHDKFAGTVVLRVARAASLV